MKLLIDLLPCQMNSSFTGEEIDICSFLQKVALHRASHNLITLASTAYKSSFESLRQTFTSLLPPGSFLPYTSVDVKPELGENDPNFITAATLARHVYQIISPDAILYPNIFAGWGEKGVVLLPENGFPSALKAAFIQGFYEYSYPQQFLDPNPDYKHFYLRRFNVLKQFELLLTPSEFVRKEAIQYLNMSPDRVVNITIAASDEFRKKEIADTEKKAQFMRFGITQPFILFLGDSSDQNGVEMIMKAFSQLPDAVKECHQIILANITKTVLSSPITGVDPSQVISIDELSKQDLISLLNTCKIAIVSTHYDGSGLLVLEAMSCGAPIIASNTTANGEVLGREDALFDPSDEEAILSLLSRVITNEDFRQELSASCLNRSKQFTSGITASKTWLALEEALEKRQREEQHNLSRPISKPKRRIAYLSPLPPQKSGIADYSADLLPYLSRFVDIDLFVDPGVKVVDTYQGKRFKLYPWTELVKCQDHYDTVVYQMGNSEFHKHMFQLLREVPGVVVLHDFYLSHLRQYIYATNYLPGNHSNFLLESGEMHGLFSMVDITQRGLGKAMWDWPLNWEVLKYAKKIIVHSAYQNTLLEKYYGLGWYPRPRVIKQLHNTEAKVSSEERIANKKILGINPEDYTFCSFGYLVPTKFNLLTIEAFAKLLAANEKAMLVFVGDMDKGEYGQNILSLIDQLEISDHVKITGFVNNETYRCYLKAADTAIQLRKDSRGETSRAVLDCMAFGIPTIINAHGSLNDYDEQDVIKLSEYPEVDELTRAMSRLVREQDYRQKIGENARNTIRNNHDPDRVASAYYDEILLTSQVSDRNLFAPMIDAIVKAKVNTNLILPSISTIAATNLCLRNQPRLLLDVTNIAQVDLRTGIQRVVKSLIKAFYNTRNPSSHIELVKIFEGKLYHAFRFTEKLFTLPEDSLGTESQISIQPGDTLFMLDTSWNLYDQAVPIFQQVREAGGRIYSMLHDMIPVRFPQYFPESTVDAFKNWIDKVIYESDEIICVSKTVVDDVDDYIHEHLQHLPHICRLSFSHNGSDIPVIEGEGQIREEVHSILEDSGTPLFLMVGTIEPRKGHAFALDAFEQLWQEGENYRLCLIGKVGWNVEDLDFRIRNHPELGRHLFFIEKATDAELNSCYSAGTALVTASVAEGFGLPIVEAALHQVPVLASDIPVFHEVGGDGAIYFSLKSPCYLAEAVRTMAKKSLAERVELAKKVKRLSWEESSARLMDILERKQ